LVVTETVLDAGLVRRMVRLAGAYLRDGAMAEADLLKMFDLVEADQAHRRAVRAGLSTAGIRVIPVPQVAADQAAAPAAVDVPAPRPASNGTAAPQAIPDGVDTLSAEGAARALLDHDRSHGASSGRLLTAQEEVGLALIMRSGDLRRDEVLPTGFRRGLPAGDERAAAFDAFILHNLRLVMSIAQSVERELLEFDDVIQAGYFGLHRSVEMFDASRGFKFSTYATNWIRQSIARAVANEGRLIRLPVHVWEDVRKIERARTRLISAGRSIGDFELAAETGIPPHKFRELLNLRAGVVSLDLPVGEDRSTVLGELLAEDVPLANPEAVVFDALLRREIDAALAQLPERESRIMALRTGLADDREWTLDEIGATFGVTRERIRQIESKAKTKLSDIFAERGLDSRWRPAAS
jgi:RNA polymerase primary sigma factor